MTLQKRHFEFIAATLKCAKPAKERKEAYTQWRDTVRTFADTCQHTNPQFKYDVFMNACGWWEEESCPA